MNETRIAHIETDILYRLNQENPERVTQQQVDASEVAVGKSKNHLRSYLNDNYGSYFDLAW